LKKHILNILGFSLLSLIIFNVLLYTVFYVLPHAPLETISYVNYSLFFLIISIIFYSLKFTKADSTLIRLFAAQFLLILFLSIVCLFSGPGLGFMENQDGIMNYHQNHLYWILQYMVINGFNLVFVVYIFIRYVLISKLNDKSVLLLALLTGYFVTFLIYHNVFMHENLLTRLDYIPLQLDFFKNTYFINLLCLSFLLIAWFYYGKGYFVLSDYITPLLAVFTLTIIIETYHSFLFSFIENHSEYVLGTFFNAFMNIGLVLLWAMRILYLRSDEAKENEHYIQNYDLLQGFVEKPSVDLINKVILKIGKRNIIFLSIGLLLIITIPVITTETQTVFIKFNILILTISMFIFIIYTLVYVQRRWDNIIGFIFKNRFK